MEFLYFNAFLKDYSYSTRLENPSTEQAFKLLKDAREICLDKMPEYAPINAFEIKKLALAANVTNLKQAAVHLQSIKPSHLEEKFRPFITLKPLAEDDPMFSKRKGDPIDFAWSAYLHYLLEKVTKVKPPSQSPSKKELKLATSYQGWVAIKKCDSSKVEDKEVLATLVGIYSTLSKKIPEYAASDFDGLEAFSEKAFAAFPERKSFTRLPLALLEVEKNLAEASKFFKNSEVEETLRYLLDKATSRCGFTPFVNAEAINGNYPELKIPKPKGNFGKKKKKA